MTTTDQLAAAEPEVVKPCHCGHDGELLGTHKSGYLSLSCPKCNRTVEAFTPAGLIDAWNQPTATDAARDAAA